MKRLYRCLLVLAVAALAGFIYLAYDGNAGIEFKGQIYPSLEAARQAAGGLAGLSAASDDVPLYCGHRLTLAVLVRGFYDGRYDPIVCFLTEAESDQLYAANRAFEAQHHPASTGIRGFLVFVLAGFVFMPPVLFPVGRKAKRP